MIGKILATVAIPIAALTAWVISKRLNEKEPDPPLRRPEGISPEYLWTTFGNPYSTEEWHELYNDGFYAVELYVVNVETGERPDRANVTAKLKKPTKKPSYDGNRDVYRHGL